MCADGDIGWIIPLLSQRTVSAVPVFNQNLYILGSQLKSSNFYCSIMTMVTEEGGSLRAPLFRLVKVGSPEQDVLGSS